MAKIEHKYSCDIGSALEVFAGRWKPEIMWHLKNEAFRFNQLLLKIEGVSQKVLTQQLRELERDGLILRTDYDEKPLRIEYSCTKLAKSLQPIFYILSEWSSEHGNHVVNARRNYDDLSNS